MKPYAEMWRPKFGAAMEPKRVRPARRVWMLGGSKLSVAEWGFVGVLAVVFVVALLAKLGMFG